MLGCAVQGPDKRVAYLAPTYQSARDIVWAELKKICAPITKNVNESRLEVEVKTTQGGTSIIVLRGWESVESLRGQKFHMLVIDEVASMRNFWEGWHEVLRPALTDYKGSVLFISTPKGFNHFYDLYRMEAKDADYKSYHFTSYDNPHLPKEEIDKARTELTEDRFAQEYMADFRKTEGLVYKEFDRNRHVIGPSQLPEHFAEIIAGADFGFTHPAAVISIGKDYDSRYFVFAEWVHRGKTDAEIAEYVGAQKFHRVYPDPENPAAIEELKRRMVNVREVKKGKGSVVAGINIVRELFKSNRLYISSECVNLIMGLETYSYAESKGERDPNENPAKENDDECLSEDTLIVTRGGVKMIKDISIGEEVMSPLGWTKVIASKSTGIKDTYNFVGLRSTANHPFLTQRGMVNLDALRYSDKIVTWKDKNQYLLFMTGLRGEDILNQKNGPTKSILRALERQNQVEKLNDYMSMYGKNTMEKFQKVFMYTMLTKTPLIMILKTFNLLKEESTQENTCENEWRTQYSLKKSEKISITQEYLLQNGMDQKKQKSFTSGLVNLLGQIRFMSQNFAEFALKNIKPHSQQDQNGVEIIAKPEHYGKEGVWNLATENGMYVANGIVVSNCDALRYPLMMDAASSSRRTAEISFGTQKNYGEDEYSGITTDEWTPHRYEQ